VVPALAAVWRLLPNRVPETPTTGNGELNFLRMDVRSGEEKTANLGAKSQRLNKPYFPAFQDTLGYTHAIGEDDRRIADEIGNILCSSLPESSEVEVGK
jgi:hypothetical protein